MKYACLGNTGLIVSKLSFGAMTFNSGFGAMKSVFKTDAEVAQHIVQQALDAGINFFDTSNSYAAGQSEEILGACLKSRRGEAIIATKCGFRSTSGLLHSGLSRRHILWSLDQSLKRLDTDWIDVYIMHRDDPVTPMEETLFALDDIVRSGKVRYIGCSNWPAWKVSAALEFQRANGLATFSHVQCYYSLVGREIELDVLPMLKRYGLGLTVWSPMASGFLSGKYERGAPQNAEDRLSGFNGPPFDRNRGFDLLDEMRRIAEVHGATVSQVAVAWLLEQPQVTSVILGASKPEQLADTLSAVGLSLTREEQNLLAAFMPPAMVYPHWVNEEHADQLVQRALNA